MGIGGRRLNPSYKKPDFFTASPLQRGKSSPSAEPLPSMNSGQALEKHALSLVEGMGKGRFFLAEWMQMLFNELTGQDTRLAG